MEPLGAAASIITLLQVIHKITILCLDVRSRLKNTAPQLAQLIDEAKALRGVLEGFIDSASRSNGHDKARLCQLEALARSDGLLAMGLTELETIEGWLLSAMQYHGSMSSALKWSLKEKDINRHLQTISRFKSTLQLGISLDNANLLLESHLATLSLSSTVQQNSADLSRRVVMDWLVAHSHYPDAISPPKPGKRPTGDWFLKGPAYREWIVSPQSILWLHGSPGSGKSVLCASVLQDLGEGCAANGTPQVINFFFDFSAQDRQDVGFLLCSLLAQIQGAKEGASPLLTSLHASYSNQRRRPSEQDLLETLRCLVTEEKEIYIIIDGLDASRVLEKVLKLIKEISEWDMPQLHLLVASRNETAIERVLDRTPCQECCMDLADVNEDIATYIEHSIAEDPRLRRWSIDIRREITEQIAFACH